MSDGPTRPDVDAILDLWMADVAPRRAPERVLEDAYARTTSTRQLRRRPWSGANVRLRGPSGDVRPRSLSPALALAVAVLTVAVAIFAYPRFASSPGGLPAGSPTADSTPTPTPQASGSAPIEVAPEAVVSVAAAQMLVTDGRVLWALEDGRVARVDPATNAVVASVALPVQAGDYLTIAAGADGLWVADWYGNRILRLDPVTLRVTATIASVDTPKGILADATGVWVANTHAGSVTRIDPATNRVVATIMVGTVGSSGPNWVAAGPGGVWVDSPRDSAVFRIDPATNRVVATIGPLAGWQPCGGFAFTEEAAWVTSCDTNTLARWIDPTTDSIGGSADIGGHAYMPAVIGDRAWVSVETPAGTPGRLVRLDPVTDGVDRTITLGTSFGGGGDIAVAAGSAWVIDWANDRILRLPLAAMER